MTRIFMVDKPFNSIYNIRVELLGCKMPQIDIEQLMQKNTASIIPVEKVVDVDFEEIKQEQDPCRDREEVSTAVLRLPIGPLRKLQPDAIYCTADLIRQLSGTIPLNDFDLPEFFYRADQLDYGYIKHHLSPAIESAPHDQNLEITPEVNNTNLQDHLNNAIVKLDYKEGFPSLPNNNPFWERLDFEPTNAYEAFKEYLTLEGAKELGHLEAHNPVELQSWYYTYYWGFRVKAFELYQAAHYRKLKMQRALKTEDTHFNLAERIVKKLLPVVESYSAEEIKDTGLAKLVDMLEKLIRVQRISVGLSATGNDGAEPPAKVPNLNLIMQQISQSDGKKADGNSTDIDLLQDDPDAIDKAQELIIQVNNGKIQQKTSG